jgi:hypothetical protein
MNPYSMVVERFQKHGFFLRPFIPWINLPTNFGKKYQMKYHPTAVVAPSYKMIWLVPNLPI